MELITKDIPGYAYGASEVGPSPVSLGEFEKLKECVLFTAEDERYLKMAGEVLDDQVEEILDLWFGFMTSHPFLAGYFSGADGRPDPRYLDNVRKRFGQWILDTCNRGYDQQWLNYQHEIARRHYRTGKGSTDGVQGGEPLIHLRYLIAFIYPITATIRSFLGRKDHGELDVERMFQAWFKSIVLQITLWSQPYAKDGDY